MAGPSASPRAAPSRGLPCSAPPELAQIRARTSWVSRLLRRLPFHPQPLPFQHRPCFFECPPLSFRNSKLGPSAQIAPESRVADFRGLHAVRLAAVRPAGSELRILPLRRVQPRRCVAPRFALRLGRTRHIPLSRPAIRFAALLQVFELSMCREPTGPLASRSAVAVAALAGIAARTEAETLRTADSHPVRESSSGLQARLCSEWARLN